MDINKIPEYNRIDYNNDDLIVQQAKLEAIKKQLDNENNSTQVKANAISVNTNNDSNNNNDIQ